MGWSLSGLVINNSFGKDVNKVLGLLGINKAQEIDPIEFEEASTYFWPDNRIGIGFFGKGTLIFCGTTLMTDEERLIIASKANDVLAFYIADNNATYCFDYFSKGAYIRRKWVSETDDDINDTGSMGEPLAFESLEADQQEEVFNAIERIMGQSFYEISEEETMLQYEIDIAQH